MPDQGCEIPKFNASSEEMKKILKESRVIAIVGLSAKEDRPSHRIGLYLKSQGYKVFGVNPSHQIVFGEPVLKTLIEISEPIDIVNIFMRSENTSPIVDQAIAKGVKTIWMQEGIVNNSAAEKARSAGIKVVMNKCIYKEHVSLMG